MGVFIYKLLYFKRIKFKGIPKICSTNRIVIKRGSKDTLNKGFRARYNLSIRAYNNGKIEIGEIRFLTMDVQLIVKRASRLGKMFFVDKM